MKHKQIIWKSIPGYEGIYEASTLGEIRSIERNIMINRKSRQYIRRQPSKMLKYYTDKDGYFGVGLYDLNHKGVTYRVSRLIALTFIPNPNGFPQVNHKDLNRKNNCVDNLEWCDNTYNVNYKDAPKRSGITRRNIVRAKGVRQIDKKGCLVATYPSMSEATRQTGINVSHICQCCIGNLKYAGGYKWSYL